MPVKDCFFGWHCWRTAEGLAHQTPQAAMGRHRLSLCSLPFGLSGSFCLPKPKFSAQIFLILNTSHKFYKWSYTWYPNWPLVFPCSHGLLTNSSLKNSGSQELGRACPGWRLAGIPPRRGVGQSYLITNWAWYLSCPQLFLGSEISNLERLGFLLLIKINGSLFENSASCLGNVSLIIYTHPTFSGIPNLNLCFRIR